MNQDEALKIGSDFLKSMDLGSDSFIKSYDDKTIKMALRQIPLYQKDKAWYREMERRLEYLDKIKINRENRRQRWFDRLIGFFTALLAGFILKMIN